MNDENQREVDESIAEQLSLLNSDAAPGDADQLKSLGDAMMNLLPAEPISGSSSTLNSNPQDLAPTSAVNVVVLPTNQSSSGRSHMILSTRIVVGITAVLIGALPWLWTTLPAAADAATFDRVFEKVQEAETLQLKVSRNGHDADVWIRNSRDVRWEETPERYHIASGSSLWKIDETQNKVEGVSTPWSSDATGVIDLAAFIGLSTERAASDRRSLWRKLRPVDRIRKNDRPMLVYELDVEHEDRKLLVEAIADARTKELHSVVAWPAGLLKRNGAPVAEIRFVAFNAPVDDAKFVVAKSLTEDGRIGKISDAQGVVTIKPRLARRWTPVCRQMMMKPGDWVRTDVRGANATLVTLSNGINATVGPGSLVEFIRPDRVRIHSGVVQIVGAHKTAGVTLLGPKRSQPVKLKRKSIIYRCQPTGELVSTTKKPRWLTGFEGSAVNESIGSLIATVDGRNVPLNVGYHKVQVEIRDQIARTTIEESFVNTTRSRLEGVFHFPLPQDASISGFGMWIGGELIEADVVEKQRAREIYETILRERRDPGLLEWTGGNIFKARVFPIEPHSEKRIKIVYTQVLPMRANQYRYSYGLRSEMLQTTPLRELSIDVLVNSTLPISKVNSPTHATRNETTAHSAHLEFSAQEYTPLRDFELVCTVGGRQSDVVVIPHQRGDDGYFMMQLTPPGPPGNWQREIIPDGDDLEVLLVCDTSASMDLANRKTQSEFVSAVLSTLGPDDRFNLAATDVDCHWAFKKSVKTTAENIANARHFLDQRISLGWTDLDRTFKSVVEKTQQNAHVIYVGDGVVSANGVNPQEFVARLKRLYYYKSRSTFHAVSTGSSFESVVMKSIAGIGGGSSRQIMGEQTAPVVARELLNEIAQPGLTDLKVEFRGMRVAGVYPNQLPNLAAGTQQILIGRYLPDETGKNADGTPKKRTGQVIVTGKRNAKPVKFIADVSFDDADHGNSFIPRLWARQHLDYLLQQGSTALIKDEIVSMSEEFHIITPYTSLLVLETDADRERFGVRRRYRMRDGERFFADGRNNAQYELAQQQMKRAADWRIGLRRQVMAQLAKLGRTSTTRILNQNQTSLITTVSASPVIYDIEQARGATIDDIRDLGVVLVNETAEQYSDELETSVKLLRSDFEGSAFMDVDLEELETDSAKDAEFGLRESDEKSLTDGLKRLEDLSITMPDASPSLFAAIGDEKLRRQEFNWRQQPRPTPHWIDTLIPNLKSVSVSDPKPLKTPGWSKEALEISKSLLRLKALRELDGGLVVQSQSTTFDPIWNRQTSETRLVELFERDRWLRKRDSKTSDVILNWCDKTERGVLSLAFELGRSRSSTKTDLDRFRLSLDDHSMNSIHSAYSTYETALKHLDNDRIQLILTLRNNPAHKMVFVIDTVRRVLLQEEAHYEGKLNLKTVYSNFVQIGKSWWARQVNDFDSEGRETTNRKRTFKILTKAKFADRWAKETQPRTASLVVNVPLDKFRVAETAVTTGKATADHRLSLMLRANTIQDWDAAFSQLDELEKLAAGKQGTRWLRLALNLAARRNQAARRIGLAEADRLAKPSNHEFTLASHIFNSLQNVLNANEELELLARLRPAFDRTLSQGAGPRFYLSRSINAFNVLARQDDVLEARKALAESQPWDVWEQTYYAQALVSSVGYHAAYDWLRKQIELNPKRNAHDLNNLRNAYADLLRRQGRSKQLVTFLKASVEDFPAFSSGAYGQYLSALVFNDQIDDAETIVRQWIANGLEAIARNNNRLESSTLYKLEAAVAFARGNLPHLSQHNSNTKWFDLLERTATALLEHPHHFNLVSTIMYSSRFSDSDQGDRFRANIRSFVDEKLESMEPARIQQLNNWIISTRGPISDWTERAKRLRKLWQQSKDPTDREQYAVALKRIYSMLFADTLYLPFLRDRIAQASDDAKPALRLDLFRVLLQRPWKLEHEVEAFGLLSGLSGATHESDRLPVQISELLRFVDAMQKNRVNALKSSFEENAHPEKMTRTEYQKALQQFETRSQKEFARHLASQVAKHTGLLQQWLRMEQSYLDMKLNQNLADTSRFVWKVLGDRPVNVEIKPDAPSHEIRTTQFNSALRIRAFVTAANLAARRSASKKLGRRLLAYCDQGIELGATLADSWKRRKYMLLIALDDPIELERELRGWISKDENVTEWRRSLGVLLAERGELKEAIRLYERIERESQLSSADNRLLADWYLANDQRPQYEAAKIATFKSMQEYRLSRWINAKRRPWTYENRALPSELDENVLFAFRALFEKSAQPSSYMYSLRNFYTACRDFRLLQMVPDALLGRTPQQVYKVMQRINDTLLHEVRDEAAADEIMKRLNKLRTAKSRTVIDLRALDLLEAMVERKSSELLNQPGPHVKAAVAALKRAFSREWANGEERQMAKFLDSMNRISQPELATEQLREMRVLFERTAAGTDDNLFIALSYGDLLASYARHEEAIQLFETAVREFAEAHPDGWPSSANTPLEGYISLLESRSRFAAAEKELVRIFKKPATPEQKHWFERRLNSVFIAAIRAEGQVSLGKGQELYANVLKRFQVSFNTDDDNHRYQLLDQVLKFFAAAARTNRIHKDLRKHAFEILPSVLKRQKNRYRTVLQRTCRTLDELIDARTALHFLIERAEHYPGRLEITWDNFWNQFGYRMGELRSEVNTKLGDLEPRLLKLVLDNLRYELRNRSRTHSTLFHKHRSYYWQSKEPEFRRVAEEVLKERYFAPDVNDKKLTHSARSAVFIAKYLWDGLRDKHRNRAIEIMFIVHSKQQLSDLEVGNLVRWLHTVGKFGESIALLQPLVEKFPNNMVYRCQLITAYSRTQRLQQRDSMWVETDKHFRNGGRWSETDVARMARCANSNEMNQRAINTFREVIALRRRRTGNHGTRDSTLTYYYRELADVYDRQRKTVEAVDALSAAIVAWPTDHNRRKELLTRLKAIINNASDLDRFVDHCDERLVQTGQDSPLIRKTLGSIYSDQKQHDKSIEQFKIALELQPFDLEIHEFLIAAYTKAKLEPLAIQQLLALVNIDKRNLSRYIELAKRMKGDKIQSERAATTIVESAPNEADHHAALAKIRESENRWVDATTLWQRAAELRSLEPTNLVQLADAQIKAKDFDGALKSLQKLESTTWPSRFDIKRDLQRLQRILNEK